MVPNAYFCAAFLFCFQAEAWRFVLEPKWEQSYLSLMFLFDVRKESSIAQVAFAAGTDKLPLLVLLGFQVEHQYNSILLIVIN